MEVVVRATGRRGETREERDDTGGKHLEESKFRDRRRFWSNAYTCHSKFTTQLVRKVAEGEHSEARAGERQAREGRAIVVRGDLFLSIDALEN